MKKNEITFQIISYFINYRNKVMVKLKEWTIVHIIIFLNRFQGSSVHCFFFFLLKDDRFVKSDRREASGWNAV